MAACHFGVLTCTLAEVAEPFHAMTYMYSQNLFASWSKMCTGIGSENVKLMISRGDEWCAACTHPARMEGSRSVVGQNQV